MLTAASRERESIFEMYVKSLTTRKKLKDAYAEFDSVEVALINADSELMESFTIISVV